MSEHYKLNPIERAIAPWLIRLSVIPRWLFMGLLVVAVIAGLALFNPIGGVILLALALLLAGLASVGWEAQPALIRGVRIGVVLLILWMAVIRFF